MARKYDIAQRIANANQKPTVVIDDEHEFTINNGKSVAVMAMALADEVDGKDIEGIDKIIDLTLGTEAGEYIKSLDLTVPAYMIIFEAIMAAFSDSDLEEVEEETKKAKKSPKK